MSKRQQEIPGTEHPNSIPEIDAAAESFKRASKKRKKAQDDEVAARTFLEDLMRSHKLKAYEDLRSKPPLFVQISVTEKVTVEEVGAEPEAFEDHPDDKEPLAAKKGSQRASKKSTPPAEA